MITNFTPAVTDALNGILNAGPGTYLSVSFLATIFFLVMRAMLPDKSLAVIYLPFVILGGLAGPYLLKAYQLYFTSQQSANTILAVTSGMIATLVVLVALSRLYFALSEKPVVQRSDIAVPRRHGDISRVLRPSRDE